MVAQWPLTGIVQSTVSVHIMSLWELRSTTAGERIVEFAPGLDCNELFNNSAGISCGRAAGDRKVLHASEKVYFTCELVKASSSEVTDP